MDRCHCICFHNMSYLPCYSLSFFFVLSVSRSDSDSQCQPGLRCFFRSDLRAIPGCQGEGIRAKDYCYDPTFVATSQRDPNPTAPPPTPRPPTPRPPTPRPPTSPTLQFATLKRVSNKNCGRGQCGKCEGDCDNDQECQNGVFLTRSTCIVPWYRLDISSLCICTHGNILFCFYSEYRPQVFLSQTKESMGAYSRMPRAGRKRARLLLRPKRLLYPSARPGWGLKQGIAFSIYPRHEKNV